MVIFHTQDYVHILEQHNNSLWQTLQYNRISSLFSHRTNSKVLLLPFIHYHIDSTSTSVVIYNIYFSVGLSYNIDFLVLLIRALLVRQSTWKFWPNLKLNDKVFFSFDYSSIGSQRTIPGGWHVATLEQFEIFKMAARYVKKYIIVLNCIQIWYIWHQWCDLIS